MPMRMGTPPHGVKILWMARMFRVLTPPIPMRVRHLLPMTRPLWSARLLSASVSRRQCLARRHPSPMSRVRPLF